MKNILVLLLFSLSSFTIINAQQQQSKTFEGYLFAYFEGKGKWLEQEQLRFAVSQDAVNWTALNSNQPIIPSSEISHTGGIRDPYLMRGQDNSFYMVATDMYVAKNGWDNNPGIIMLKSDNLIRKLCLTPDTAGF